MGSDTDSAGFGGLKLGGGWLSVDWCGPVNDSGVGVRGCGGRLSVDQELGGE